MADTKATALAAFTPVLADIVYAVDDPDGTPVSGKLTLTALNTLFGANITVGATSQVTGLDAALAGKVAWSDAVDADIIPDADGTRDIGSAANRFAEGHFDALFIGADEVLTDTSGTELSDASTIAATDELIVNQGGTFALVDASVFLADRAVASSLVDPSFQDDTDYTLVLADASTFVSMNSASAHTLTIPPNSSVPFPVGTVIAVQRVGTGAVSIQGGTGVAVNGVTAGSGDITAQWGGVSLVKVISPDAWRVMGAIGTVS